MERRDQEPTETGAGRAGGADREPSAAPGAPGPRAPLSPQDRTRQEQLTALQRVRRARLVKVGIALVLAVLLIVFVLSNAQPVTVHFVFGTGRPRLIWVMLVCIVLGGMIGYLIGRPGRSDQASGRRRRKA